MSDNTVYIIDPACIEHDEIDSLCSDALGSGYADMSELYEQVDDKNQGDLVETTIKESETSNRYELEYQVDWFKRKIDPVHLDNYLKDALEFLHTSQANESQDVQSNEESNNSNDQKPSN